MLYSLPKAPDAFHSLSLQKRPLPDHGRPQSARSNPDFIDHSTLIYASAALGVVHHLPTNRQLFLYNRERGRDRERETGEDRWSTKIQHM